MVSSDLRVYRAFSFKRGLDVKRSPLELAMLKNQDRLTLARNVVSTISGGVTKRFDQAAFNTSSIGATVAITGGIQYRKSDGTVQTVGGTDDGRLVRFDTNGATANLATGLATGRRWSFDVYNDKLLTCNGSDAPRKYDGTTVALLGGSPPSDAQKVVVHQNRVFFLKPNSSLLTWSALNDEEDFIAANNAGSMQIMRNDGSQLIDAVPSISELVLLKGRRPYRLQGTAPSTYAVTNVVPTTGSTGAISFQADLFALNDVWLLSEAGITTLSAVQTFGDLREAFASEPIDRYFTPGTDYTLSLNQLDKAVAVYDFQNNRLMWGVDSDNDGKNDTLLSLDLYTKFWGVWPSQSCASLWMGKNATTGQWEVFMGGYDGFVRVLNRDLSTNTIDGHARHISCFNTPGVEKSPRHVFLYFAEEGNWNVTVDTKFDFGNAGGQTYTASLLGGSKTLGVNWTLGVDPLGKKDQIVKRIDVSGVGEFMELGVRNTAAGQPFTWLGYEVMWRPRRVVRRGSSA